MESSLQGAYDALTDTVKRLDQLLATCSDREHASGSVTVDGRTLNIDETMTLNAVTPHMQALQTSFGRELWFSALHAIHHWSMVRVVAGELVSDMPRFASCQAFLIHSFLGYSN